MHKTLYIYYKYYHKKIDLVIYNLLVYINFINTI